MDLSLRNKLIEIIVDKFLIGMLILLAGFLANSSLERYKLIETQRVGDTTEFVKSCHEVWANIFEYESIIDDIDAVRMDLWLHKMLGTKNIESKNRALSEKIAISERKISEIRKITDEKKFVLGNEFVIYFWRYMGYVKMRADAKIKLRDEEEKMAEDTRKLIENLNKQIASMRFTADSAREYALSRLPH